MNASEVDMLLWEVLRPRLADAFATESLRKLNIDTAPLSSITLTTNALLMALLHQDNVNRANSFMREILTEAAIGCGREMLAIARTERSPASEHTVDASSGTSRKKDASRASSKISANVNDATLHYYPNIRCILCKEWLCSRNRYMHMESHYNYRPYRCTAVGCEYTNRKEIFVEIHAKKVHNGEAGVLYVPDNELEKKAWAIAEKSLDQTKLLLTGNGYQPTVARLAAISGSSTKDTSPSGSKGKFRPRIHNSQRNRKSRLIELGRKRGLIPKLVQKSSARHASSDAPQRRQQQSHSSHHPKSEESPFLCAALRQVEERRRETDEVHIPTDRIHSTELEKLLLQQRNCLQHGATRTRTSPTDSNSSVLTALLFGGRK